MGVSVRHNSRLAALVALVAAVMTVAWFSRALQTGSPADWAWCALVAAVGVLQLLVLRDGRAPLMVADEHGVRVRHGETWSGLRWQDIEHVEVQSPASWLRDGRIIVHPAPVESIESVEPVETTDEDEEADRSPVAQAYVVPLSRTTKVEYDGLTGDLVTDLDALASGRVPVLVLTRVEPESRDTPNAAERPETKESQETLETPRRTRRRRRHPSRCRAPRPRSTRSTSRRRGRGRPSVAGRGGSGSPPRLPSPTSRTRCPSPPCCPSSPGPVPATVPPGPSRGTGPSPRSSPSSSRWTPAASRSRPRGPRWSVTRSGCCRTRRRSRPSAPWTAPSWWREWTTSPPPSPTPRPRRVIGPLIAAARQRARLSIDTLSERTRIRPHVLESIEVDDFEVCGGDFYARGHLRTLARIFGLDAQQLLDLYDDRYAKAEIEARQVFEAELATGIGGGVRAAHTGPRWTLLAACVLALASVWGVARVFNDTPQELVSPAPNVVDSAGLAKADPAKAPESTLAPLGVTAVGASPQVVVRDRSGRILWAGKLAAGQHQQVIGLAPFDVTASNGRAVKVSFLDKAKGTVGPTAAAGSRKFG